MINHKLFSVISVLITAVMLCTSCQTVVFNMNDAFFGKYAELEKDAHTVSDKDAKEKSDFTWTVNDADRKSGEEENEDKTEEPAVKSEHTEEEKEEEEEESFNWTVGNIDDNSKYDIINRKVADDFKWKVENNTLYISGHGDMPEFEEDQESMGVLSPWRYIPFTSVVISDGITGISGQAFAYRNILEKLTLPDSLTYIGYNAFEKTAWLENQPDGLVYIGKIAYAWKGDMPEKTEIIINDGTASIAPMCFYGKENLVGITVPNSVTTLGEYCFGGCKKLADIDISDNVAYIGGNVFEGTVWYNNKPDGMVYIGKTAYKWKGNMPENTAVKLRNGTLLISANCFADCSNLASIDIPESVGRIEQSAFSGCTGLKSISLPQRLTEICDFSFYKCTGLSAVSIPNNVKKIGWMAFAYCSGISDITVPENTTTITGQAFEHCTNLATVTVPGKSTYIEGYAFSHCEKLANISICEEARVGGGSFNGTLWYDSQPDGLIYIGKNAYAWKGDMPENTVVKLNPGTTNISSGCFNGYDNLVNVILPKELKYIESYAFCDCSKLADVEIPLGVTFIGIQAFRGCTSFKSLKLPNSVTTIRFYAFADCTNLTDVAISASISGMEEGVFYGCSNLKSVTFPKELKFLTPEVFYECPALTEVFYTGNEEEWADMEFGYGNDSFKNAKVYFYNS